MTSKRIDALIDGALDWAESGVPVFPCRGDKSPLTSNGHLDAVTDPDKVRALFEFYGEDVALVGAAMGKASGLFVVDVDLYKGAAAEVWVKGLQDKGMLPPTRMHKTARGGLHLIYEGAEQPNCKPHDMVEVKGEGGYVIVPPSPGYTVESTGVTKAPNELLSELRQARRTRMLATDDALRSDILTGAAFHDSLTQLAARLARAGKDQADIQGELLDLMNKSIAANPQNKRHERWRSVMYGNEIPRLVKSGYSKYNINAATNAFVEATQSGHIDNIAADLFAPAPSDSPTVGDEPVTNYTGDEWPFTAEEGYFAHENRDVVNQRFSMYPIYAENETVVLFAEPKTGKTALALTTALHIACGMDFGAFKVSEAGACLYYGLEGKRAIELRIESWRRHMADEGIEVPEQIPMFTVTKSVGFLQEEQRQSAANQIIAADKYCINTSGQPLKVVYIDTLTKAMSGGDQNSVEDTSHLFDLVSMLRTGGVVATLVFVHHKSRSGGVRGSTNIEAEPDVLLDVSKEDSAVEMFISRARSIEDGMRFRFTLHGYDLGVSEQGHQISGLYVKAAEQGEDAGTEALAQSFDHADRMKVLVSQGPGALLAREYLKLLMEKSPSLLPVHPNAAKMPKKLKAAMPRVNSAYVQEFLHKLVPHGGTMFGGFAILPSYEGNDLYAFSVKKV